MSGWIQATMQQNTITTFSTNFSQIEQLKKKTNFSLAQNRLFFLLILPVEKEPESQKEKSLAPKLTNWRPFKLQNSNGRGGSIFEPHPTNFGNQPIF